MDRSQCSRSKLALVLGLGLCGVLISGCMKQAPPTAVSQQVVDDTETDGKSDVAGLIRRWAEELKRQNSKDQTDAIAALLRIAKDGHDVISVVVPLAQDRGTSEGIAKIGEPGSTREAVVMLLRQLGPAGEAALEKQVLPVLIEGLKDESPSVREHTARALGLLGPKAKPALEALAPLCADPKSQVREAAYRALDAIGEPLPAAVVQLVKHADSRIRGHALAALAVTPSIPVEAVTHLVAALKLKDLQPAQRNHIAHALSRLGTHAAPAIPELVAILKSNTLEDLEQVRDPLDLAALDALAKIGPPAIPALKPLLKDAKFEVRWQAVTVLGAMGPAAQEALPDLEALLKDPQPAIALEAALALLKLGGDPKKTVELVKTCLAHEEASFRSQALQVARRMRRAAEPLLPAIIERLTDEDPSIQVQAVRTLQSFGPAAKAAVPALVEKLTERKARRMLPDIIAVLRELGPEAQLAAVPLARLLPEADSSVLRQAIFETLQHMGSTAADAVPALLDWYRQALQSPQLMQDLPMAIDTFAAIGPAAKTAVPLLVELIPENKKRSRDERDIRLATARALGKIGDASDPVVPRLLSLAKSDPSSSVRPAALRALAELGPAAQAAAKDLHELVAPGLAKLQEPGQVTDPMIYAAVALIRIEQPTPELVQLALKPLRDPKCFDSSREATLELLDLLGEHGKKVQNEVIQQLNARSHSLRLKALEALLKSGSVPRAAESRVLAMLQDTNRDLREQTIQLLGQYPKAADFALSLLRDLGREKLPVNTQRQLFRVIERIENAQENPQEKTL